MVQKLPEPLIDLYNVYIHGGMTRREFVDATKKFAVGGLTTAIIIDMLMPNYALGEVVKKDDARLKTEYITIDTPEGNGKIKGYFVRRADQPAGSAKLPGILVVHENRGLNPHIEDVARRFALEGFMVYAPDGLTSVGGYPGDDDKGGQLFNQVNPEKQRQDMLAAAKWLKARPDCTGKIGATGFCYGGGVANILATWMGADLAAIAPFYGANPPSLDDVKKIKAAVLVHHGATDARLVMAWPAYEAALKAAGVTYEGYLYEGAGHGFNNDSSPQRYNEAASKLAMQRSIDWFKKYVK
jgi:carboxymethylenebutenolidase